MTGFAPFLSLAVLAGAPAPDRSLDRDLLCMGTHLGIHLEGAPRERLGAVSNLVIQDMERIEGACSTWRADTFFSRLNAAGGAPVALPPEWLELLASAREWSRRTQGTFDPVLMSLLKAWGTRTGGRVPTAEDLALARQRSGSGLLELDPGAGTASLGDPGAGVEEGGFLKGYALDSALKVIRGQGVPSGWVDLGGQILVWGRSRETAIADPDDRQATRLMIRLPDSMSLSSSGCSERGRHILDPRTGVPCPDWGSVTVAAPRGLDADVLSTALYVMGPERGLAWATEHGTAAVFLLHGGRVAESPAFTPLAHLGTPGGQP